MMISSNPGWAKRHFSNRNKPKDHITVLSAPGPVRDISYTGAGPDGKVQPDMPMMTDKVQYHEGEGVIPAKDVAAAGGMENIHAAVEQQKRMKMMENMPSVKGFQEGTDNLTVKQRLMSGEINTKQAQMLSQPAPVMPAPVPAPTGAKAQMLDQRAVEEAGATVTPAPAIPLPGPTGAKAQMLDQRAVEEAKAVVTPPRAPVPMPAAKASMLANRAVEEAPAAAGTSPQYTPEQIWTRNALSKKLGRGLTEEESQRLMTSSPGEIEQWMMEEGVVNYKPPTGAAMPGAGTAGGVADEMLNRTADLARGNPELLRRMSNIAFGQLDGRLQTAMTITAMQIANNPNMTEGAKRAAMAQQLIANGVQQSDLAAQMADKAITIAVNATNEAYQMASLERAFGVDQKRAGMEEALAAGNVDEYARIAKELYGITIDPTKLKSTMALKDIADGNEFLATAITQFGDKTTLATAGVRSTMQKIWDAEHPGQPMDDTWATEYIANFRQSMDPAYQAMMGMSEESALPWFGGDAAKLAEFRFGGKTGLPAFRSAMFGFMQGGAFHMEEDGFFDFNEDSPLYQAFLDTFSDSKAVTVKSTVTNTDGSTTVTYSNGSTKTTKADGTVIGQTPAIDMPDATAKKTAVSASNAGTGTAYTGGVATQKVIAGGSYYDTSGKIFFEDKEPVLNDAGTDQLVRKADGKIVDPKTGQEYRIDDTGEAVLLTFEETHTPMSRAGGGGDVWLHEDGTYTYRDENGEIDDYTFAMVRKDVGEKISVDTVVDFLRNDDPDAISYAKAKTASGDFSYYAALQKAGASQEDLAALTSGVASWDTINDGKDRAAQYPGSKIGQTFLRGGVPVTVIASGNASSTTRYVDLKLPDGSTVRTLWYEEMDQNGDDFVKWAER